MVGEGSAQDFYTPEEVAERLRLHVKTVRQFLRDGRLRGARVGKQYRIARADLQAFAGGAAHGPPTRRRRAEVMSTIRIDAIDPAAFSRITNTLMAALAGDAPEREPVRLESAYDEQRAQLTLTITGDVDTTARLLKLIHVLMED